MRFSTLEIRWHDTKPIFSCDFQPFECVQHKRQLNPYQRTAENVSDGDGKLWRVATAGGDNNVRIWLAIPNPPLPPSSTTSSLAHGKDNTKAPQAGSSGTATNATFGKPKVEYLATLDRHTLTVNVVRFSPSGHLLATAGDDSGTGGILLWRLSANPATATFGSRSAEDAGYEKEAWQAIKMIKSKSPEIYDMAWSPDGQYLLAGGTDGAARIHRVSDGSCVAEMLDHKDWVQGVAWDPLNKFIATQGKDRQMMIYSLLEQQDGSLKVTLVSKNARLITDKAAPTSPSLAPSSSTLPTSETITQNAEASSKPALPPPTTSSQIMYSDEESTPFFRRLAFATDGSLLITPAGQYEDPSGTSSAKKAKKSAQQPQNGDADVSVVIDSSSPVIAKKPISKNNGASATKVKNKNAGPSATSYIFARGQFGNETPIGHLPGHRTASIVVKFNPVLWNLRSKKGTDAKGKGKEKAFNVDEDTKPESSETEMAVDGSATNGTENESAKAEEVQKIGREIRQEAGIYDLKQRTIYAVATHDTISIYDTQQEAPVCMFSSLHFAAFTDLAWTADGLTLIATSSDGYASIFTFEEGELGVPCSEQPKRSMGSLEDSLINGSATLSPSKPTTTSTATSPAHPHPNPSGNGLASTSKAENVFASPAQPKDQATKTIQREDSDVIMLSSEPEGMTGADNAPKKVKKRVALTHVGPLGS